MQNLKHASNPEMLVHTRNFRLNGKKDVVFFQDFIFQKVLNSGHSDTNGEFNCISWPCKTVFSQLDKIWNENLEYQMRAQAGNLYFPAPSHSNFKFSWVKTDTIITKTLALAKTWAIYKNNHLAKFDVLVNFVLLVF